MADNNAKLKITELDLKDKLVYLNRTAKVVKGGRRFGFSAIVVVGDGAGHVGVGHGKAKEVAGSIAKATEAARKNVRKIRLLWQHDSTRDLWGSMEQAKFCWFPQRLVPVLSPVVVYTYLSLLACRTS